MSILPVNAEMVSSTYLLAGFLWLGCKYFVADGDVLTTRFQEQGRQVHFQETLQLIFVRRS